MGLEIVFALVIAEQVGIVGVVARIDTQDYISALGAATGQLDAARASAKRAAADFERIQNVYNEDPGATSQTAVPGQKTVVSPLVAPDRSETSR